MRLPFRAGSEIREYPSTVALVLLSDGVSMKWVLLSAPAAVTTTVRQYEPPVGR